MKKTVQHIKPVEVWVPTSDGGQFKITTPCFMEVDSSDSELTQEERELNFIKQQMREEIDPSLKLKEEVYGYEANPFGEEVNFDKLLGELENKNPYVLTSTTIKYPALPYIDLEGNGRMSGYEKSIIPTKKPSLFTKIKIWFNKKV